MFRLWVSNGTGTLFAVPSFYLHAVSLTVIASLISRGGFGLQAFLFFHHDEEGQDGTA
ncbi:hypothetical protein [Bacillus canaveralius]|uniref:hypothetical protein n=1 Tax=Bacillus canaveralius TaxID=1403243 RepID=UPI00163AF0CA|nr:hypothetical protein [Bacillus canaveralius]